MLAPLTPRTLSSLATASSSEGGFGPGARIDARAPRLSSSALDIDFPVSVTSHHSFKFAVSGGSDADQGDAFDDSFGEQALGSDVGVLPSGTRGTPVQTRKVTVSAIVSCPHLNIGTTTYHDTYARLSHARRYRYCDTHTHTRRTHTLTGVCPPSENTEVTVYTHTHTACRHRGSLCRR